jgi:hypothetical protein
MTLTIRAFTSAYVYAYAGVAPVERVTEAFGLAFKGVGGGAGR